LLRSAVAVANAEILKMFRFSRVKPFVLVWALSAMVAAATDSDLPVGHDRELEVNRRNSQDQELLRSNRQLQSSCGKTSKALDSALVTLVVQAGAFVDDNCVKTSSCPLDYGKLPAYNSYKSACSTAKGALATYKFTISCSKITFVYSNVPICLVSKNVNQNCAPKLLENAVKGRMDLPGCSETATNTGYTDYSGTNPKPVKKPVKRPVRRRALAMD
jgi:hypothetical protein